MTETQKAPFPYFGAKAKIASKVWELIGNDVSNYIEPFVGSAAVLLAREVSEGEMPRETINDNDFFVVNFWRALRDDPVSLSTLADYPISEIDLHTRHDWLVTEGISRLRSIPNDPYYYDLQTAGWWVWGLSCWLGRSWCAKAYTDDKRTWRQKPNLSESGVHRKNLYKGEEIDGLYHAGLSSYLVALATRLRRVRIMYGDWQRVVSQSVIGPRITGIFLDPPYAEQAHRDNRLYAKEDSQVANRVKEWCLANGDNPNLRIVLCGYEGEHNLPWRTFQWQTSGGYGNIAKNGSAAQENKLRETLWISPHCLGGKDESVIEGS